MDKLRAIECFVASAEAGSFSRAAQRLEVSIPAVAKMVTALERSLGARLFERTTQGLTLSSDGTRYLDACRPLLEQLREADEAVGPASGRVRGLVTIGAPALLLQNCLVDAAPALHARFPDLELDFRVVSRPGDPEASAVDVFVLMGWMDVSDFVARRIAQTRYRVYASPAYWAAHGKPQHPSELARHPCLCFRNPEGTLLDLWRFEQDGTAVEVSVRGWAASSHREFLAELVAEGHGVMRMSGLATEPLVAKGLVVPVLADWTCLDSPPIHLLLRPGQRRVMRVRQVAEFITELFRRLEAEREGTAAGPARPQPAWQGRQFGRASRVARR